MNKIFAPFLPPWVETGLQPAFYDMESGTVLQQTARMYAKVQQLTRLFNELSEETKTEVENFEHSVNETVENFEHSVNETVSEYIEKFTQLKDFVEDYFDNLDVQEEINNKLDAMVEDGTLQEVINNFLQPNVTWTFDTVADMQAFENFENGCFAQTLGYYSVNDGGKSLYYIRTKTGGDTANGMTLITLDDNTLIAELVCGTNDVNVLQLGIKKDGVTDNYTALSTAISLFDKLYFPTGSYLIGTKITLNKSITMYGDGAKLGRANYSPKTIIISPDNDYAFATTEGNNCIFERLSFQGRGIDILIGNAFECDFISPARGIYRLRGRADKCYFKCDTEGIYGAVDSVITNCIFADCDKGISLHGNDNRIENNRLDWNNVGIELVSCSYNTIIGNVFDRNTTYGITSDNGCSKNIISSNNFERNLEYHLSGDFQFYTITGNQFLMKEIIDGDPTSEKKPVTAFNFSSFTSSTFVGNRVECTEKFNNTVLSTGIEAFAGNSVNGKQIDHVKVKLGDLTLASGATGTLQTTWSSIKSNILNFANGSHFQLDTIEVRDGQNRYMTGSGYIKEVKENIYYDIQITFQNPNNAETTFAIYADFVNIEPMYLNFA